ncbi:lactonase family protein [Hymenobacter jejuensis]|uniref:Lactonase family protein n=1 Tax=Hymenobacter jejuensis TaxID=2502781 RepID=A0A5B8A374_9BACT|nr:lactonase family protein [Hymenobacter jejuensis]QDA61864.1 lactonase family protein [Hymenobacter jejuensis]
MSRPDFSRRHFLKLAGLGVAALNPLLAAAEPRKEQDYLVYIGTYAKPEAESIFLYSLNPVTGALARVNGFKAGENPSYLTLAADRRHLYAVNETTEYEGAKSGAVSAFAIDGRTGGLTLLNRQPSLGGAPCYISLDHTNHTALVANYVGGNVSAFPVQANGQLSPSSALDQHHGTGPHKNQTSPHAHCILPDPANRFAFAVDLGTDQVTGYQLDVKQGKLTPNQTPAFTAKPGAGPRHLTFHPNKRWAFLINELNSTVTALNYDAAQGTFTEIQTLSSLPADFKGENSCADIHVSPDGKFLYGSNRGHNSIAVFAIDASGHLTLVQHADVQGKTPRNFTLDPTGRILLVANQNSNNIFSYFIDKQTGKLRATGKSVELPSPVYLQILPDFRKA